MKGLLAIAVAGVLSITTLARAATTLDDVRGLLARGEKIAAASALEKLVERGTKEGDAFLYLGVLRRERDDLAGAIEAFERGLAVSADHLSLKRELAISYAWAKRHDESLTLYEQLLKRDRRDIAAWSSKGRVLLWAGRHSDAESAFAEALRLDAAHVESLSGMGSVHLARMRYSAATTFFERALAQQPGQQEAADGLQKVEDAKRWSLRAGGGVVHFPVSTTTRATGYAELAADVVPELSLRAAYRLDSPAPGSTSAQIIQDDFVHNAGIWATTRPTGWLTLEPSYELLIQSDTLVHRPGLHATVSPLSELSFMAGARPGISHAGTVEVLMDAGVQLVPDERYWLMAQAYYYRAPQQQGPDSWTLMGTGWVRLLEPWTLRVSLGGGSIAESPTFIGALSSQLWFTKAIGAEINYTVHHGGIQRHAAQAGGMARF